MSALRLTPAAIIVLGVIALLIPATTVSAQESGGNPSTAAPKAPSQSQPSPSKSQTKAAPKRNQGPLPANDGASGPATSAGCGWIGKRVIHSLLRDDAVTAQDFDRLYHTFSCSPDHLRAAFDCTVAVGAPPTAAEAQTRVDSCWTDPKFDAKTTKIAPAKEMPTASGTPSGGTSNGQPKSGSPKAGGNGSGSGSTPNYPASRP